MEPSALQAKAGDAPGGEPDAPLGETSRWLDGSGRKEDSASKEQANGTRPAREQGDDHPWDAFFNAPEQREEDRENADDRPAEERSHNPRVWCDRRGRVEWRPGAGKGACPLDDERISHCLGRILRYHTERFGLQTDAEGWVSLASLLTDVQDFEGVTEADIRRTVQGSVGPRGPRFEIREAAGEGENARGAEIRALYKHPQDGRQPRPPFGDRPPAGFFPRGSGWGRPGRGYGAPPYFNEAAYFGRGGRQPFPPRHPAAYSGMPRQRLGFSPPPADQEDGNEQEDGAPRPAHEAQRPRQNNAVEGDSKALGAKADVAKGRQPGLEAESQAPELRAETSSASASTTASTPKQEVWERYHEPDSKRAWFWNEATEEVFYADDEESGWQRFLDAQSKPWWWHEATGRFFYEEEEEEVA